MIPKILKAISGISMLFISMFIVLHLSGAEINRIELDGITIIVLTMHLIAITAVVLSALNINKNVVSNETDQKLIKIYKEYWPSISKVIWFAILILSVVWVVYNTA